MAKRLEFVQNAINTALIEYKRTDETIRILDFGCGTGEYLTKPLAMKFRNEAIFFAYDTDEPSLIFLENECKEANIKNVIILNELVNVEKNKYDIVIASETIEHVTEPEKLLDLFSILLQPQGKLILTLPNGYGYFELSSLLYNTLVKLKLIAFLKKIKNFLKLKKITQNKAAADTLAVSPHISFFTYNQILRLLDNAGFSIEKYDGRTFICGSFLPKSIFTDRILALNNMLGSKLPPSCVSDWMFVCLKNNPSKIKKHKYTFCINDKLNYKIH